MHGNHLEGDSRVMFYVNHTSKNGDGHVIDRGYDADLAIILSYNADMLTDFHLSYDFIVDYTNSREYLDITMLSKYYKFCQLFIHLHETITLHYFTGTAKQNYYSKEET